MSARDGAGRNMRGALLAGDEVEQSFVALENCRRNEHIRLGLLVDEVLWPERRQNQNLDLGDPSADATMTACGSITGSPGAAPSKGRAARGDASPETAGSRTGRAGAPAARSTSLLRGRRVRTRPPTAR